MADGIRTVAGDKDDTQAGTGGQQMGRQRAAIHPGKHNVGDEKVDRGLTPDGNVDGGFGTVGFDDVIAAVGQNGAGIGADSVLILD